MWQNNRRWPGRVFNCLEGLEPRLLLSWTPLDFPLPPDPPPLTWVDFEPPLECDQPNNISTRLWELVQALQDARAADPNADLSQVTVVHGDLAMALRPGDVTADGDIKVQVRLSSTGMENYEAVSSLVQDAVLHQPAAFGYWVVTGRVSYADVEALSQVPGVIHMDLPIYAVPQTGSVTTGGDSIHNADDLRALTSVDGTGVKIGVISNGVDHKQYSIDSGDLPDTITVHEGYEGGGDKGTAMLEIVHDLAAGAQLYLSSGIAGIDDMLDSIDWLTEQGCDVIVDDLWFPNEPFFQDGYVAEAATDAIASGVSYVTAAGNFAETHYQAGYVDFGDGSHQFATGQNVEPFYLGPRGDLVGALQWSDEWESSGNEYDLYLYQWTGSQWSYTGYHSTEEQNGDDTPFEFIQLTNPYDSTLTLGRVIHRYSGSSRELELFTYGYVAMAPGAVIMADDSISGHAAAEGVIAAAASPASAPTTMEDFSSRGTSTIYTNFTTQTKNYRSPLDITGIDEVQTKVGLLGYFSNPFSGTSAAALASQQGQGGEGQ